MHLGGCPALCSKRHKKQKNTCQLRRAAAQEEVGWCKVESRILIVTEDGSGRREPFWVPSLRNRRADVSRDGKTKQYVYETAVITTEFGET